MKSKYYAFLRSLDLYIFVTSLALLISNERTKIFFDVPLPIWR